MKTKQHRSILVFLLAVLFTLSGKVAAQDIHFSMFSNTPLLINPAQTAVSSNFRVITNFRNQWQAFGAPYRTYNVSAEAALNHTKKNPNYMGLGIEFFQDKAGDSQMGTMEAALTLSGILEVADNNHISGGFLAGFTQRSINYSKLHWENQYDGLNFNTALFSGEQFGSAYHYIDLGGGLCWKYGKAEKYISANDGVRATAGISAWHFGLPKYSYAGITADKLNTKIIMHGLVEIGLANSNMILVPSLLLMKQGPLMETDLGGTIKFILSENSVYTGRIKASAIGFGVTYRNKDALIPQVTYENSAYAFGFSYDANISKLKAASAMRGGIEVFIRYSSDHLFTKAYSSEAMYN